MKKIILYTLIVLQISCDSYSQEAKINGVSFVASDNTVTKDMVLPLTNLNVNWVTLMPFGFMNKLDSPQLQYNLPFQWVNERKEGLENSIKIFKQQNIKIMLKPQIWIQQGEFTGHINMKTDQDWISFEKNYAEFILFYATIAEENKCELFCIGTELNTFVKNRPGFWIRLIPKIKQVYTGKITYAENWDTYQQVPFVNQLDYIGIDAYFPLVNSKTPKIEELEKAWSPIKQEIKSFSEKHDKKVLFTEYGYQSKDFTADKPWEHHQQDSVNLEAQENSLTALYQQFWSEDFFAGGFIWKWFDNYSESGGLEDNDYTIQNKPSEEILKKYYYSNQ